MQLNPILKIYLSTFFLTALVMEISLIGISLLSDWLEGWKYVALPVVNGIISSSILVPMHLYKLRKAGVQAFTEYNMDPVQSRNFETRYSKLEIIELLNRAKGTRRSRLIIEGQRLTLDSRWWIFGQIISICLGNLVNGLTPVVVESRPVSKFGILDFGVSWKNVEYIKQLIQSK